MEVTDILDDLGLSFSDKFTFEEIPGMDRRFAPSKLSTHQPKQHEEPEPEEDVHNLSESLLMEGREDTHYRESLDPFRSECLNCAFPRNRVLKYLE